LQNYCEIKLIELRAVCILFLNFFAL